MNRSRNFTFTHNNYENTDVEDNLECRYIVYGKEVGKKCGTPHLQGFVCFQTMKSKKQVIKLMPGCHIEVARDAVAAIEYCKKDGDVTERGEPPCSRAEKGAKEKRRWDEIHQAAEEGRFEDIDPEIRVKYDCNIERIRGRALKRRKLEDTEQVHEWYYGASGTGKSRKARTENPLAYLKMCNKWWDGYEDEDVVLIEDLDKNHSVLCHHLKIWADRYPFRAEMKGSGAVIRPGKIIVTSNYSPEEIWSEAQDLEPIRRRFRCIRFDKI